MKKSGMRLLVITVSGICLSVFSGAHTEAYVSWLNLLFENTKTFANYNLFRFDLIHMAWFACFWFSVISNAINIQIENSSFASMIMHRQGIGYMVSEYMKKCLYSLMLSFGVSAITILSAYFLLQKGRAALMISDLLVSVIYYCRSIVLGLVICIWYCGLFLGGTVGNMGLSICVVPMLFLLIDLVTKGGMITFTCSIFSEIRWLFIWSVLLLICRFALDRYMRKKKDIL